MIIIFFFLPVGKEEKEMHFSVGYDDTESIKYFSDPFKAAWTTRFPTFPHLLDDYEEVLYFSEILFVCFVCFVFLYFLFVFFCVFVCIFMCLFVCSFSHFLIGILEILYSDG